MKFRDIFLHEKIYFFTPKILLFSYKYFCFFTQKFVVFSTNFYAIFYTIFFKKGVKTFRVKNW